MIFQEKKITDGYEYKVEEIFGTIVINSDIKLDGDTLDRMVSLLLTNGSKAQVVSGEVKHDKGTVSFTFTKEDAWSDVSPEEEKDWDDNQDTTCENTPTSTKEMESAFTRIRHSISRIWSKLRRSVIAIRDVWEQ